MQERIENSLTLEDVLSNKKYSVNYYQREYRWGRKQIEQLIEDLTGAFEDSNDRIKAKELDDVEQFDYYYMGTIIVTGSQDIKSIIDGQQRLTSMTLLLIALNNLHKKYPGTMGFQSIDTLIFSSRMNKRSFNINVEEWTPCLNSLFFDSDFNSSNATESVQNICNRYNDIIELLEEYFGDNGDLISLFACWLVYKIIFIKITTPSEQDAHKVFVSMNDRGLSLNTSEMLKGYLLSEIKDDDERNAANTVWKEMVLKVKQSTGAELDGSFNTEDVNFISTWIRAKYAQRIREGKKDSKDQDYEIIGREFHEWIRQNHTIIGLTKSDDFKDFIMVDFRFYAQIYLRLKEYSANYTKGYKAVFYNADKELYYQNMLIMAALNPQDSEDVVNKKIKLVSTYIDCYSARRLFNYAKVNWNSNKNDLFTTIKAIRNMPLEKLTVYLTYRLLDMDLQLSGILTCNFGWNQFTGRYMLHMLARFTDFVDVSMGNESLFDSYVNRKVKNSYDREHVLPDKYEDYQDKFSSLEEFNTFRWKLGNLILLKLDKNRSYQDMNYTEKKEHYLTNNIIAQSFHPLCYARNPKFNTLISTKGYNFKPYEEFGKDAINERQELYATLSYDIWSEKLLRDISGLWDTDYEEGLKRKKIDSSTCVDLISGKMNLLTSKKPIQVEYGDRVVSCSHYVNMVLEAIQFAYESNPEKLLDYAKDESHERLVYVQDADANAVISAMRNGKETGIDGIIAETHGSGKDLGLFCKEILETCGVTSFKVYVK